MRLFRTEEAARVAGLVISANAMTVKTALGRGWVTEAIILTDRERRLLEALEDMISVARALRDANGKIMLDPYTTEAANALIRELAVEG